MTEQLAHILEPDAIAIVGASNDESKRGHQAIVDLTESAYQGDLFAINPNAESEILGYQPYATVSEIPAQIDLAFVATPSHVVPSVLEDCGEAGVAGAVLIAAGFAEAGNTDLEERIVDLADEYDTRLIGPNIQGISNVHAGVDLLGGYTLPPGKVGLLTQSGNIGLMFAMQAERRGTVGFSFNVGVGNESDLQFHEYLNFLESNDKTDAIVVYAEGMVDGRAFLQQATQTTLDKPIVVLKGGATEVGKFSASSHTNSLAGSNDVIDAVYEQAGVVKVDRSDEVLKVAEALSKAPTMAGFNVGVLSDGGGNATIASDALSRAGLHVPRFTEDTQTAIAERVPNASEVSNPTDIIGQANDLAGFADCADIMLRDPNIDALLLCGNFGGYSQYGYTASGDLEVDEIDAAESIARLAERHSKPIVVQSRYFEFEYPTVDALYANDVPVYASIDSAVFALTKLSEYGRHLDAAAHKSDFELPGDAESFETPAETDHLSEYESKRVLDDAGLPVVPFELAKSASEASQVATEYDGRVSLKIASPDVPHKTEAEGVRLDVPNDNVARAYDEIIESVNDYDPDAAIDGVLVSPMVDSAVEVIVGVMRDEEAGPVLMFGSGGIFTEILDDVTFRALPVTEHEARNMISEVNANDLLEGARGRDGVDRERLVDLLLDVSELVLSRPEIVELDLNPVFVSDNVDVVDASIQVASE